MNLLVSHLLKTLHAYPQTRHFWIAYSGGLDSHVLLHALAQLRAQFQTVKWDAVHIHHGLQLQADNWAQHCQMICERLGFSCRVIRINVPIISGESLEASARTARYQALTQLLQLDDVVFTGQHADDQAETVLLQLFRGAGPAGLAAMPAASRLGQGWLVRPFLTLTREQLHDYAQQNKLQWIEDSSNANTRFDRNFLRHEMMPQLRQRWPSLSAVLSRVAHHQAEAQALIETLAAQDWQTCQGQNPEELQLSPFSHLSPARQRQVLRFWLNRLGLPWPSTVQLEHVLTDLLTPKMDRQPVVRWPGVEVRRYRQTLFAMPNLPPIPKASDNLIWMLPQILPLPLGHLQAHPVRGQGLSLATGSQLTVRFRQGGETFYWRGHQRQVKKLLQTIRLPPWQRPFIPLIYYRETLIALPQIGITDRFTAKKGDMGWQIQWVYHLFSDSKEQPTHEQSL